MSLCSGTADFKSNLLSHCNSLVFRFLVQLSTLSPKSYKFNMSVTLSNLNRFSNFCTAEKRIKFATKII